MHIHELLQYAVKNGASDIHISAGEAPMLRTKGEMVRVKSPPLSPDEAKRLIYSVMNEVQKSKLEEVMELDFSIGLKGLARFRVNAFVHTRGMGAVFRVIPVEIIPLSKLSLPQIVTDFTRYKKGLVLVTGPTGSGKSTTLAAIINEINQTRSDHILTIEDPVEFHHKPKKCLITQREIGPHSHSFSNSLKSALRQDPDVILIGELRDIETISLALTAAETGHLVFGTLHTKSAPETIDRMIDVFPAEQQGQARAMLSEALRAVMCQNLMKTKDGNSRVCAYEIMVCTHGIRNLIREGKIFQINSMMQTSSKEGSITLEQCLKDLVGRGRVHKHDAIDLSGNANLFSEAGIGRSGR